MSILTWQFSPLSCSLMSLLASRTHEWKSWSISEGGEGAVDPQNVTWVELSLELSAGMRRLRCHDLANAQALKIFEEVCQQEKVPSMDSKMGWNLAWQSDSFLSEIPNAYLSAINTHDQEWQLIRGSTIAPSLWGRDKI